MERKDATWFTKSKMRVDVEGKALEKRFSRMDSYRNALSSSGICTEIEWKSTKKTSRIEINF